jgi:hypothetical protein
MWLRPGWTTGWNRHTITLCRPGTGRLAEFRTDRVESFPLCQIMSLSRRLVRVVMGQIAIKSVRDS